MDSVSVGSLRRIRPEVVIFAAQVILLFIVVIVSLVNLSIDNGNTNLWTAILTSCLGYMLPHPNIRKAKDKTPVDQRDFVQHGVLLRDFTVERDQPAPAELNR